jgi:anti-sigma factor RsiW
MSICNDFDRFRDGELAASERSEFESHLAVCQDCRMKMALLNNLVSVLKSEEVRSMDLADQIARRAFQQDSSWSALIVSWMRPGPVLATLALLFALFSFLLIIPANRQVSAYSEYEKLMSEADAANLVSATQIYNDSELRLWLSQEEIQQ